MNAPPSCRTCVRFKKCMEALRYYPCIEYKRGESNGKPKDIRINVNSKNNIRPANMDS